MRLVFADLVSYRDAFEFWDLDEVIDAHELLDIREEADEGSRPKPAGSR